MEGLRAKMTEEIREREKTSAGTGEGSAHSGVGSRLQCPVRLGQEELPETGTSFSFPEHTLLHVKTTRQAGVGPPRQPGLFLAHFQNCP